MYVTMSSMILERKSASVRVSCSRRQPGEINSVGDLKSLPMAKSTVSLFACSTCG